MLIKHKKALMILSILLLQVAFFNIPVNSTPDAMVSLVQPSVTSSVMASRAAININGNSQLISSYGISSGSGTELDPYIIENYLFDCLDDYPILIQNTNKYITIRNCAMYTSQINTGLYISNCTNIRIENCILYYDNYGIYITNSNRITVTGCTVYNADEYGVYVYKTNNTIVTNCVFFNNTYGVVFSSGSNNNEISNCRFHNHYYAIAVSSNNVVKNCTVSGVTTYGVAVGSASNVTISDCDIGYASATISLQNVNDSSITRCYIHNSGYDGISSYMCNRLSITYCDISYSANSGIRTYYDVGDVISNCNLHNNYYYGVEAGSLQVQYVVSAINCYWGSSSGPGYDGTGPRDYVSSNVNYSPYLSSSQTAGHRSASDLSAPVIELAVPFYGSTMNGLSFPIGANYYDNIGVNTASVVLKVDNVAVTPGTKTNTTVRYAASLSQGLHNATVIVADAAGNAQSLTWFFFINTALSTPIRIFGNDELHVGHGVIAGTGTSVDPYIIQGRAINCLQGNGITILETDKYIVVRDCSVSGGGKTGYGMLLYDVTHILVDRVSATENYYGLYLHDVINSTINACNIFDNENSEIESRFYGSNAWMTFSNCVISGSKESYERGMQLMNSPYSVINCTFYDCFFAIHQQGGSKNQFINNTFYNNNYGIITYSSNNTITGCVFYNNSMALDFASSSYNAISFCSFDSNYAAILGSSVNTITYCSFYGSNTAISDVGASNEIHQCNFLPYSQSYAISTGNNVNATYCYWGTNDGPKVYGTTNTGSGDTISTNVLYTPWLTAPVNLNFPTLKATVASKNGTAGSAQTFTIEVRNNAASQKTIYLAPFVPTGWSGSLSQSSITLGANQTGTVTFTATSPSNAANGYYPVAIKSSDTSGGFTTGIGSALYGIGGSSSGTKPAPSITISQSSKSGTAGTQQSYSFTINNNDVSAASFLVSLSAPNGWTASASSPISVPAGSSASGTAYITSPSSAAQGSYTITITVTNSGDATNTASNTMTYTVTSSGTQPSTDGGFPFWIIIIIALAVAAAGAAFLIIKKKNDQARLAPQPPSYYPPSPPPPSQPSGAAKGGYICPKCGAQNEAGAKFCYRCGNRQ